MDNFYQCFEQNIPKWQIFSIENNNNLCINEIFIQFNITLQT